MFSIFSSLLQNLDKSASVIIKFVKMRVCIFSCCTAFEMEGNLLFEEFRSKISRSNYILICKHEFHSSRSVMFLNSNTLEFTWF